MRKVRNNEKLRGCNKNTRYRNAHKTNSRFVSGRKVAALFSKAVRKSNNLKIQLGKTYGSERIIR